VKGLNFICRTFLNKAGCACMAGLKEKEKKKKKKKKNKKK
jgi:hypothetical protein